MKRNSKAKMSVALFAALFALAPMFSLAATFNNDPLDYQTLRVGNYTDNPSSDSSSWGVTANADAGETVNFGIYYHNTSGETATNMRVRLTPQSTGTGNSHVFTAYVWADNAPQVSGSATVYLSSSQSIAYKNSIVWRPNQTTWGSQTLPNGQSGSEIFSTNGLLLGDIGSGWTKQGNVIVAFLVSGAGGGPGNLPSVTTNAPTYTSGSSWVMLNGYVNPNGTSDTTRWFEWGTQSYSLSNSTTHLSQGASAGNFTDTVSNLSSNTTYYYRAVAQNSAGTVYGGIQSFVTTDSSGSQQPFVSTNVATNTGQNSATLNCYVNPYNTSATRWFEWGTTQSLGFTTVKLSHGSTASNAQETITGLLANTTYYFRCTAQNSYGTSYGSILSFVTTGGGFTGLPTAITNLATNVDSDAARLNGMGLNLGNVSTDGWFEWGPTATLGNTTSRIALGSVSSNTFYSSQFNLSPNTTYYYRAVVQNQNGIHRGDILNFRTNSTYIPPVIPPVNPPTPLPSKDASVVKRVANLDTLNGTDQETSALRGETVRYTIEVRNTGTQTIKNASIKDRIPHYVEFANAEERARLDGTQREVVWFLGDFLPGETRTVSLDVIATSDAPFSTVIENVARLEGDSFTRNSNTAIIRVTDVAPNAAAAAFFGGDFLPNTFAGWVLLTILLLILVLLGRKTYEYYEDRKGPPHNLPA